MPLITVKDLVEAKAYDNEQSALDDAVRCLLRSRPDLRIRVATRRYQSGEISLAKAAYLAGVSWQQMREILVQQGTALHLGPENKEDADEEVSVLRRHFK